jgi:hypothetical protein
LDGNSPLFCVSTHPPPVAPGVAKFSESSEYQLLRDLHGLVIGVGIKFAFLLDRADEVEEDGGAPDYQGG